MRPLLIAAAVFLAACPPPPQLQRPYAPPTAEDLLAHLRARRSRLRTLRAETRVDHLAEKGDRVKVTVNMLLERGGKMRLEAESALAGALATLVSDGAQFALLDVRNNRFLYGPASACNVARLIRVSLPPADIVDALMGGAPVEGEPVSVGWDPERGGREVLTLKTPDGGSEVLKLDARDRRWDLLAAERKDASGRVLWRVEHEDFGDQAGLRVPSRTTVVDPPNKADARIKFRDVELNVEPKEGVFTLEPPANVQPEYVTCP